MFPMNEAAWTALSLGAALKSFAVLGAAWLMALALRKRSAASRHLVWTGAAAALVALPLFSISLPGLRVPAGALLNAAPSITFHAETSVAGGAAAVRASAPAAPAPLPARSAPHRFDAALTFMRFWTAGAVLAFGQMLLALGKLRRMRRAALPYPAPEVALASARALGIRRRVEFLETPGAAMPMAFGVRRPAILMPACARVWTEERRRVVLLHELAHVRRADAATHLLARAAVSLFWWNPLAWSAWREFLKERERAADDLVLTAGEPAADYAGHLLAVARSLRSAPAPAAVAMARCSDLEGRLRAILDAAAVRTGRGRTAVVAAALLAIAIAAPLAALRAQDPTAPKPVDVEATIRQALAQKDHAVLDQAAQSLEAQRQYEAAQKLLETSLALREQQAGAQSASYAAGLLKLGDVAAKRGAAAAAEDYYSRAVALGDSPDIAPALLYLANRALGIKDYQRAQTLAEHALNIVPTGSFAARALVLEGNVMLAEDLEGVAESYYLRALSTAEPGSTDSAYVMETYVRLMRKQARDAEADAMSNSASAIRKQHISELSKHLRDAPAGEGVSSSSDSFLKAAGLSDNAREGRSQSAVSGAGVGGGVYRVGNGVSAPVLLYKKEPEYSEAARVEKTQGTVVLSVVIGPDGRATDVTLVQSLGFGLDEKAFDAVTQWKFKPGMQNGIPVSVTAQIEVNFRLL